MDLIAPLEPLMTSPLLYPVLAGLCSLDGVLPVIPSEPAVLAAGVFAHTGTPNVVLVIAATAVGVFIGDHLAYGLSRSALGPRLIGRSTRIGGAVAAAGRQLDRRAGQLIVISRFLPGGRTAMNLACGTARLPLSRFSPASAIAALAWAAYTAGLGFVGGAAFVEGPLFGLAVGLGLSFALGSIVHLVRRRSARREVRAEGPADPGRADTGAGTAGPTVPSTAPGPCSTASGAPRTSGPAARRADARWKAALRPVGPTACLLLPRYTDRGHPDRRRLR